MISVLRVFVVFVCYAIKLQHEAWCQRGEISSTSKLNYMLWSWVFHCSTSTIYHLKGLPNAAKNSVFFLFFFLLDSVRLIVASAETPMAHRSCDLLRKRSLMMNTWVRCRNPTGQYHKCLHLLQPQGCIGLKILTINLIARYLSPTYPGLVWKTLSTSRISAPPRNNGDKFTVRSFLSGTVLAYFRARFYFCSS